MPEDKDKEDGLTEGAKQLYGKTRVPHKFCPYCGHRNEADVQDCANCGKDISWMRIPEPVPVQEPPKQKPRSLPKSEKIFTTKAVIIFVLIILLILTLILVLVLTTSGTKNKGNSFETGLPAVALWSPAGPPPTTLAVFQPPGRA